VGMRGLGRTVDVRRQVGPGQYSALRERREIIPNKTNDG